jgi:hypothetical protein
MLYRPLAPLLKLAAAAFALLLVIDLSLFRSGLYYRWAEPESTAGSVMRGMMTIRREYDPERRNILVLGNSRITEGFSAQVADSSSGRSDLHFINGSIAGTTPRGWYYLLRTIDPDANRFAAIALMVDYDAAETRIDMTNYPLDTPYLMPLLRLSDLQDYPDSFTSDAERERARRSILLPLQAMHDDVQNMLAHPIERRDVQRIWRRSAAYWSVHYGGQDAMLPDLQLDTAGMPVAWGADEAQLKPRLEPYFHELRDPPPVELQSANAAYLREWLTRIPQRYSARDVPIIVFVVPRGPWHERQAPVPRLAGPIAELAAAGRITSLPGDAFVSLEQPQFFFDAAHMNRYGRERFSKLFARQVAERIH